MSPFTELGLATIAALTIITSVVLITQTWERNHARATEAWLTAQREHLAAGTRANRDIARILKPDHTEDD